MKDSILCCFRVLFLTLFIMTDRRDARNFPSPTCKADVREFLGLIGFCHNQIDNYTKIVEPLTSLLKTNVPFVWTDAHENAFRYLKSQLTWKPVLNCCTTLAVIPQPSRDVSRADTRLHAGSSPT